MQLKRCRSLSAIRQCAALTGQAHNKTLLDVIFKALQPDQLHRRTQSPCSEHQAVAPGTLSEGDGMASCEAEEAPMQIPRAHEADHVLLDAGAQLLSHHDNRLPFYLPCCRQRCPCQDCHQQTEGWHCSSPFILLGASHLRDEPVLKGHRPAAGAPIPRGHADAHSAC